MKDRVAISSAALAALLHAAVANRYDLFRDELYFIVCGRHPAFGYVDQPPLVPLLAAAGYALGEQTWVVRIPEIFAVAALAFVVVAFVRLLGGGDIAAWLAAFATTLAPVLAGLTSTLNTTTFEPLAWTTVAYAIARFAILGDRRAPLWGGVVVGIALEVKYAIPLWLAGLAVGLLFSAQRRIFARPQLLIGMLVAAAIAAPSLIWQANAGWPFAELVRNAHYKDVAVSPLAFVLNQLLIYSPPLAPLWIGGAVAAFAMRSLREVRFIAIGYAITAAATVAGHGKDYYLAAAIPSLFTIGAVALQRLVSSSRIRVGYAAIAVVTTIPLLPLALPILPPDRVVPYETAIHLAPQAQERGDTSAFPPTFGDMLGWHDFTREVGAAYLRLTPTERATTAIVVDNYGQAAALELYGAAYGFPRILSGHNQYFRFGPTPDAASRNVLRVQDDVAALRPYCGSIRVLGTTHSPYARSFENGMVIAFCDGLRQPLSTIWPALKRYI